MNPRSSNSQTLRQPPLNNVRHESAFQYLPTELLYLYRITFGYEKSSHL